MHNYHHIPIILYRRWGYGRFQRKMVLPCWWIPSKWYLSAYAVNNDTIYAKAEGEICVNYPSSSTIISVCSSEINNLWKEKWGIPLMTIDYSTFEIRSEDPIDSPTTLYVTGPSSRIINK